MAVMPCGSTCVMGAIVEVRTGRIVTLPSISGWNDVHDKFQGIDFRHNSCLVVLSGARNEKKGDIGQHFLCAGAGEIEVGEDDQERREFYDGGGVASTSCSGAYLHSFNLWGDTVRFTPTSLTINQLFNSANEQYVIPTYQRRYSWTEKQVWDLIEDISQIEGGDHHLLGSVVCLAGHHQAGLNKLEVVWPAPGFVDTRLS